MTGLAECLAEQVEESPVALVCGGGSLPFAVAETAALGGRRVVLFPLHGSADPDKVAAYSHHWITVGQIGRLTRLARQEGCRDMVFIGTLVRPAIGQLRPDFETLRLLPRLVRLFRGGDSTLLAGIAHIFEERGFRVLGAHMLAPQILMPAGLIGSVQPSTRDYADIERGLALLRAIAPFDVGQAAVVADNRVLAVEAAEGTDQMLERLAALRRAGRVRAASGAGVLVKAPNPKQDLRLDLPSIGPQTIEGAARAGLAGIAVVAASSLVAEAQLLASSADRHGLFVLGVRDEPPRR